MQALTEILALVGLFILRVGVPLIVIIGIGTTIERASGKRLKSP
jgi:hypothetical protein